MITRFLIRLAFPALALVLTFVSGRPLMANGAFQQDSRRGCGMNLLGWDIIWQNSRR